MASLKLVLLFGIILALTRLKIKIGFSIAIGSVIAGFIFSMSPGPLADSIWKGIAARETWELFVILMSVTLLGSLLKESGLASGLTGAVESLLHSKRASMAILPALIGLLPMPGGALLSAPLVDESSSRTGIARRKLAAINYWFRHVLEYIWPLYPGIILSASILEVDASTIVDAQWPMSIGMIVGGIAFLLIPLGKLISESVNGVVHNGRAVFMALWPIFLAVFLSLFCGVDLHLSVPVSLLLFILISRFSGALVIQGLKQSMTLEYTSFVFAVMIFKQVLIDSNAACQVAAEITAAGIDPIWVILFLPFVIGLISGATPAFVSLAYPALLPFLRPDDVDLLRVATAYTAGFLGVLLSPLHFCLVLTASYFKARLLHVYIYLVGPLLIMIAGLVLKALV
jgi:integral membrane protein (TIGR00529 family)